MRIVTPVHRLVYELRDGIPYVDLYYLEQTFLSDGTIKQEARRLSLDSMAAGKLSGDIRNCLALKRTIFAE